MKKKRNTPRPTLRFIPGILAVFSVLTTSCDSDKVGASYEVLKRKAEDKLVDIAGKGQVALQMHRDRHAELKASQIRMVAYEKTITRKRDNLRTRIAATSDPQSRAQLESLAFVYETTIPKLQVSQEKGRAALARSIENYERLKVKVEVLETQIDVSRTLTNTETAFDVKTTSREVDALIEALEQDLDLAEAAYEVESLDLDLP